MTDIRKRMDAWQKADRSPEWTSSFLRTVGEANVADAAVDGQVNPQMGSNVKNATNVAKANIQASAKSAESPKETPVDHTVVKTPVDDGDDEVDPPQPISTDGSDPHDGCGCPVSAALHSMKEEAEAADLYNKRANKVDDPHAREVYRDIAKEEMVHLGEAAELLREADPELAMEVPKGMEEAGGEAWKPDIDKAVADRQ